MTNLCAAYLETLATNPKMRMALVEALRASAQRLEMASSHAPDAVSAGTHWDLARQLRDAAQRLCDHARTSDAGRCRYCDGLAGISAEVG